MKISTCLNTCKLFWPGVLLQQVQKPPHRGWRFLRNRKGLVIGLGIILFLLPVVYFVGLRPKGAEAGWFNDQWLYRKPIAITNAGSNQTDFQVKALSNYDMSADVTAGKVQSDFDDLRFTDINGNLLDYWIEDNTAASLDVWIKMASIPTSGATVYMYYGNPSANAGKTKIGTSSFPGFSCKSILDAGDSTGDGVYYIDPTNNGDGSDKFQVYCNMTADSGGWTLVMKLSKNDFCYGSSKWTDSSPFNEQYMLDATLPNAQEYDAKSKAFYSVNADALRFYSSRGNSIIMSFVSSTTPKNLITTNDVDVATDFTLQYWLDWRNVFGLGRQKAPIFMRAGTTYTKDNPCRNNPEVTPDGCGQLCTFCWQACDGDCCPCDSDANDVNFGIGLNVTYCGGGDPADCSTAGNWSDTSLRTLVWARGPAPSLANISASEPGSEEASPGPIAYWKFDEGYGSTTYDSTQNGNDGTFGTGSSAPTWQSEDMCVSGKCLYFDGTSDYVDAGNDISLNMDDSFTISAWIRVPENASKGGMSITAWGEDSAGKRRSLLLWNGGSGDNKVYFSGYGAPANLGSTSTVDDNKWHHTVVTLDSGDTAKVYIDGVLENSGSVTLSSYTFSNAYIAATLLSGDAQKEQFEGFIDEVKIYPYVRTAAQIKTDYNAGLASGAGVILGTSKDQGDFLSEGLVGYWKMDENSWGSVLDSSGNENHGTTYGEASIAVGKFGNGGAFDGTGDYVQVPSSSNYNFSSTNFTISTWFQTSNLSDTNQAIFNSNPHVRFALEYNHSCHANTMAMYLSSNAASWNIASCAYGSKSDFNANEWYHATLTWDGSHYRVYINGVLDIDVTSSTGIYSDSPTIRFGYSTASEYLTGGLDEFRIYRRALSPKEVRDLYNWAPGPVAHWKMDEKTGTSAYDNSGNNNNSSSFAGSPTWTIGKYGGALGFDGSLDYINVPSSTDLNPKYAITFESWFKTTSSSEGYLGAKYDDNIYTMINNSGKACWYVNNAAPLAWLCGTSTVNDGTWHYYSANYNGSTMKIYVDGVLENSSSRSGEIPSSGSNNFQIGARGSGYKFDGLIDETKIYNYARTQKQIVSDMNAGHPAVGSPVGSAVAHWDFDEGYGTTVNNTGNGGVGLSGNFGSGSSAPSWSNDGNFGKALSFDGSDYVNTGDPTDGSLDFGTNSFSLSTWLKTTATGYQRIISKGHSGFSDGYLLQLYTGTGYIDSGIGAGGVQANGIFFYGNHAVNDGNWHHVVSVFDQDTKQARIYIDGSAKNLTKYSGSCGTVSGTVLDFSACTSVNASSSTNFNIGRWSGGTEHFSGLIDEVKIYNYALTEDEVKLDYNQGKAMVLGTNSTNTGSTASSGSSSQTYCVPGDASACNPPVAEWSFDEGSGSTANDRSGNSNTGTITGATWSNGKVGNALKFNGSSDYVNCGDVGAYATNFTISLWFKYTASIPTEMSIIEKRNGILAGWALGIQSTPNLIWRTFNGSQFSATATGLSITQNAWHFVELVHTDGSVNFYIDGRPAITKSITNPATDTTAMHIGDLNGGATKFQGQIDQVRIYDYARTPAQIAWDYNRGGPVGWWDLDECEGTTVHDMSGLGNTGMISIGASGSQTTAGSCGVGNTAAAWSNGASGKYNASLNFDGTDDYVDVGTPSISSITGPITLSAWANFSSVPSSCSVKGIMSRASDTSGVGYFLGWGPSCSDTFSFRINNSAVYAPSMTVSSATWYHIVGIYDASQMKIYVNGSLKNSTDYSSGISIPGDALIVGAGKWAANPGTLFYWPGQIDDARIYNYALTATQVKQLYNQGSAVRFGE